VPDLHVTILYSKTPVDWLKMGESSSDRIEVKAGGPRVVEELGDEGATVLQFASSELQWRHESMCQAGASHDYEDYIPHITISYSAPKISAADIEPYRGKIILGAEIFEEID
jgi:hypothetical protein